MAQAKRRKATNRSIKTKQTPDSGLGMLFAGILIGGVLTTLILGFKDDPKHGFGSGINQMIEKSRQPEVDAAVITKPPESKQSSSPNYDFYTILPEIEQIVPDEYVAPKVPSKTLSDVANVKENSAVDAHYLLQAGSFIKRNDADHLKASLALLGHEAYIQKVSIDGKTFYRVRTGPYRRLDKLNQASKAMAAQGIHAMRIKVANTVY